MEEIRQIFERITEYYDVPIRLGSRCEANVYYRIEDLTQEDVRTCAEYVAQRITKVSSPNLPTLLISLSGSYTGLAEVLAEELAPPGETLRVIQFSKLNPGNGHGNLLKKAQVVLVNDVITTARSCLEAHSLITMNGASMLCWASLVDRTFGPGPVPVIASFTGEPVRLLEEIP